VGLNECIHSFNTKDPNFVKGSLYVFISNLDGTIIGHGGNSKLVRKNLMRVKSPSGVYPSQVFQTIIKTKGAVWTDYKWLHPITRKVQKKNWYT